MHQWCDTICREGISAKEEGGLRIGVQDASLGHFERKDSVLRDPNLLRGHILLDEIVRRVPTLLTLLKPQLGQLCLDEPDARIEFGAAPNPPEPRKELGGAIGLVRIKEALQSVEIPGRFLGRILRLGRRIARAIVQEGQY